MEQYFNLPFVGAEGVRCPYFNNAATGRRGQLGVLSGKGLPKEIVAEAKIISLQYHAGIFDSAGHCCLHERHGGEKTAEQIRKFLIDNRLGVDCSGFVTNILAVHYKETKNINLPRRLCKNPKNILRRFINHFRPVENTGVRTYADDKNTNIVLSLDDVRPLDMVVMTEVAVGKKHNHILLITTVENGCLNYAHARAWSADGLYGHGVARGSIIIRDKNQGLLQQRWTEGDKEGEQNETWLKASRAKTLRIRRLNF